MKLTSVFYPFKQVVRNVIDWFPVIVKDRHFDGEFMYDVMLKKLELQEAFFRSEKAYTAESEKTADEIHVVIEVLERLIEDDYFPDIPSNRRAPLSIKSVTEPAPEGYHEEQRQLDQQKKEDREYVFNTLRDNIERWWD